jgi:hypothetical protein
MRVPSLLLVTILSFGCAAKKIAVNNADSLLSYQITKRIPLNTAQKNQLDEDLTQFLKKKQEEAQDILPFVDQITLNEADLEKNYQRVEELYRKIAQDFSHLISRHMAQLKLEGQREFFDNLRTENKDLKKKGSSERLKTVQERFEHFLGPLTEKQADLLKSYRPYYLKRSAEHLKRREALEDRLKLIYKEGSDLEHRFNQAFADYQNSSLQESKNLEILKKFIPTMTKNQKERFRRKLQEIKDLLQHFIKVDY